MCSSSCVSQNQQEKYFSNHTVNLLIELTILRDSVAGMVVFPRVFLRGKFCPIRKTGLCIPFTNHETTKYTEASRQRQRKLDIFSAVLLDPDDKSSTAGTSKTIEEVENSKSDYVEFNLLEDNDRDLLTLTATLPVVLPAKSTYSVIGTFHFLYISDE